MRVAILAGLDFKGGWHTLSSPGEDFDAQKKLFKSVVDAEGATKIDGKAIELQRVILFNSSGPAKRAKFASPEQRKARAKELAEIKARQAAAEAEAEKAKAKPKAGGK